MRFLGVGTKTGVYFLGTIQGAQMSASLPHRRLRQNQTEELSITNFNS